MKAPSSVYHVGRFDPSRIAKRHLFVRLFCVLVLLVAASAALAQDAPKIEIFNTPGPYVWEVPANVVGVTVEAWGGGGRGGTRTTSGTGGGGGGGAYVRADIEVTPGEQIELHVGAGSTTASAGADSRIEKPGVGVVLRAQGGASVANNDMTGAAGGSASGSVVPAGGVARSGGAGANASDVAGARWGGGGGSSAGRDADGNSGNANQGGSAPSGGGAGGGGANENNRNGAEGTSPGGGGGGANRVHWGTRGGGAGANGRIVLTYREPTPVAQVPLFLAKGLPPNILMILDNSDSMQEGLDQGRVALDWANCVPGPDLDPDLCPAGARSEHSKASMVKQVGRNLVDRYEGRVNLGLMAYQQYPPSQHRDAVFRNMHTEAPATVLWRLTHRPGDVRYWECGAGPHYSHPPFYSVTFEGSLSSHTQKRFFEEHPTLPGWCIYYNFSAPGYYRDNVAEVAGTPELDDTTFAHDRNVNPPNHVYRLYSNMVTGGGLFQDPDSGLSYGNQIGGSWWITLTDSMRQRGLASWGDRVGFTQLNQIEWRANHSPGLGYLHVPIGGFDADGNVDSAHWQGIRNKLAPQRHDWVPRNRNEAGYHNAMVDPSWPLIAAGLTPLQGTMRTARAYFQGSGTNFGPDQGNIGNLTIPQSCDINAAVWVTDGLPSVRADGTELGENPVAAVNEAAIAIQEFHDGTAESIANRDGAGNPVRTYIVGFARPPGIDDLFGGDNPLDILAAAGGTAQSYNAETEEDLYRVITDIFAGIVAESRGSAVSAVSSSTRIEEGTLVFQARFDSFDWSGEFLAFEVNPDGTPAGVKWGINPAGLDPIEHPYRPLTWLAADGNPSVDPGDRTVITWDPDLGQGRYFTWANLTATQQQSLSKTGEDASTAEARLEWLRGSRAEEGTQQDPGPFRRRSVVLGDIVNSEPVLVGNQDWRFHLIPGEGSSYAAFRSANAGRTAMVYVGANDGMLHGFEAYTGVERMAFVPNNVFPNLARLTDPDYQHRYFVDGSPRVLDAYIGGLWRSVLVGSTGAGGNSVFAIDVTDPDDFGPDKVLWELEGEELGFSIGRPTIARLATGQWVAIFGNGFGTPSSSAKLVIVDLATGSLIRTIDTGAVGVATPNALSDVVPLSLQRNGVTDFVYAGDLLGNLWKFDLRGNVHSDWKVAYGVPGDWKPLFKAVDPSGDPQPITVRPLLVEHPDGGHMVLFGTGQLFREGDQYSTQIQSFYGIRDYLDTPIEGDRDQNLEEQAILFQGPFPGSDVDVRVTSNNPVPSGKRGWYIDLVYNGIAEGERSVTRARFRDEFVLFSTAIPDPDPCGFGGRSWLMELNAFAGTRPSRPILDLDGDGEFDSADLVAIVEDGELIYVPASGIRPAREVGIFGTPTILRDEAGRDVKLLNTSLGGIETILNEGSVVRGRQTWRQLR